MRGEETYQNTRSEPQPDTYNTLFSPEILDPSQSQSQVIPRYSLSIILLRCQEVVERWSDSHRYRLPALPPKKGVSLPPCSPSNHPQRSLTASPIASAHPSPPITSKNTLSTAEKLHSEAKYSHLDHSQLSARITQPSTRIK